MGDPLQDLHGPPRGHDPLVEETPGLEKRKLCTNSKFSVQTVVTKALLSAVLFSGFCSESQQNAAHHRHPAQEPDQTNRLLEQLPEGSHGRRAVQRREDLPNQTDQGSEETGLLEKHPFLPSTPTFYQ